MFNIKGQSKVRTHCGGCVSLAIIFTTITFAMVKLGHLLEKHNPTVNIFTSENAFNEKEIWRAKDQKDFMMAFAVTDALDFSDVRDDPNFVKWLALQWPIKNGKLSLPTGIPMHKCSKEELNRFHEPRKDQ